MSAAPEDEGIWLQLEYDREARCFVFECSCKWGGATKNLHRAAAPIGEHLRSCTGEPPTMLASHYEPERHREARVDQLPKHPADQEK